MTSDRPSRTRATLVSIAFGYVSMALLFVQGVVLVPLYVTYLDPKIYGAWLASGSVVAYLGMLEFGGSGILAMRIASCHGSRNHEALGVAVGTGLVAITAWACIPFLLGLAVAPWIPGMLNIAGPQAHELQVAFVVAAGATSLTIAGSAPCSVLVGLQRQLGPGVYTTLSTCGGIIATVWLLTTRGGVTSLAWGMLVRAGVNLIGMGLHLGRVLRADLAHVPIRARRSALRELVGQTAWSALGTTSRVMGGQSDNLVVALFLDPVATTTLALTKKASEMVVMIASRFSSSFVSGLAHLFGESARARGREVTVRLLRVSFAMAAVGAGAVVALNDAFVTLWVGRTFYGGGLLNALLAAASFASLAVLTMNVLFYARGDIRTTAFADVAEGATRLALSLALIGPMATPGVAAAALVASAAAAFPLQLRWLSLLSDVKAAQILRLASGACLKGAVPFAVVFPLVRRMQPQTALGFLGWTGFYLSLSLAVVVVTDPWLRKHLADRVSSIRRR